MKRILIVLLTFALLGLLASAASAQNVTNPSVLTFTASIDHAVLTSYVVGFFAAGAQEPMQESDIGKPTPDGTNTVTVTVNTRPIAFGMDYTVKVKSVAGSIVGEWSSASNPWNRRPGKPGDPAIR